MDNKAVLERAFNLANEYMHTIDLQYQRIKRKEPEDAKFVMRWWVDLQFLILALSRFRKSVSIASKIIPISQDVKTALKIFDVAIPDLRKLRDVGEHLDVFAIDDPNRNKKYKNISRTQLQVGSWDGVVYEWLDVKFNVKEARNEAIKLYKTLQNIKDDVVKNRRTL